MTDSPLARLRSAWSRYHRWFAVAAVAAMGVLAFAALHLILNEVHLRDVRAALAAIPAWRIALAVAFTVTSYLLLTFYDRIALMVIGKPQPWRVSATASFTSYAMSHNLGLALLTGGSARYRVYSRAGLSLGEVAQVTTLGGVAFWTGVILSAGLAMILKTSPIVIEGWSAAPPLTTVIGIALVIVTLLPLAVRLCGVKRIALGPFSLPLPDPRHHGWLALASIADLTAASAALFVLIPGLDAGAYPTFFLAYALAIIVALLTHVPGGLGVFEAVVLAALPGDRPTLFAGLLIYRLVYYLFPLMIAAALIAVREGRILRGPIGAGLTIADRIARALAPTAVTLLVFAAGFILLVSGALPGVHARLTALDDLVPLPLIEFSHLAGSLVGTALLLTAPALNARMRSGFLVARVLLFAGAIFSVVKGLDYEEAAIQLSVAGVLQYARPAFYRRGGIAAEPLDARWLAAALAALSLSIWAGFFAYKRVAYADDLWWRFAISDNAPRFLRATFAAGALLTLTAVWNLMMGRARLAHGEALPKEVAERALAATPRTDANLAFTGDKRFIVSAAGDAFLMYRVQGRTWIVMGDPVGPEAAWDELAWAIRRACDLAHGRLCFYQTSAAMLPLLVELGLGIMKYGEEAQVPLGSFTLAGPKAKDFRHALRRADTGGLTFSVVAANEVAALIPELAAVSDAWLAERPGGEKRFSLGPFDPTYLQRFPCAIVRHDGRIVAFANIWETPSREEVSVDLMRHCPDAPPGTMDMMFVRLIEWGRDAGYKRFNLGIAPLAGLPEGRLAPVWARVGRAMFEHGGRFYGFAGLRAFKAKFSPEWRDRYVATPRGLARPRALLDLVRVVNS